MSDANPYQPPRSSDGSLTDQQQQKRSDALVVLATFENAPQAHCLRIELENNGISATVANEQSAQVIGASLFGRISAIWVEVLVLKSDLEAALAVKNRMQSKSGGPNIPEWTCRCGATVDAGFGQCWSCMAVHNQTDSPGE